MPCKAVSAEAAELGKQGWPIEYLNVEDQPEVAQTWGVGAYPTVVVFTRGAGNRVSLLGRVAGVLDKAKLVAFMRKHGVAVRKARSAAKWESGSYL